MGYIILGSDVIEYLQNVVVYAWISGGRYRHIFSPKQLQEVERWYSVEMSPAYAR